MKSPRSRAIRPNSTFSSDRVLVVQGDALDPAVVERAVQGTDAVICILNTSFVRTIAETKPVTRITQNILNSMKSSGVHRLIITSAGIPEPNDRPDLRFSLLLGIGKLIMPPAVEDTIRAARIVQSSDLDWTVIRMVPTNAAPTGRVNAGYIKREIKVFVSRADAAMFILKELGENNWVPSSAGYFQHLKFSRRLRSDFDGDINAPAPAGPSRVPGGGEPRFGLVLEPARIRSRQAGFSGFARRLSPTRRKTTSPINKPSWSQLLEP